MFSVKQKREIADAVQKILRDTDNPELPKDGEISFALPVDGTDTVRKARREQKCKAYYRGFTRLLRLRRTGSRFPLSRRNVGG